MKKRIDQLLVEKGLTDTRSKAQALVMAGLVYVATKRIDKSSATFTDDVVIEVKGKDHPYVSRGGVKLAAALSHFNIKPDGWNCLDVGASTGGFTDVLLRNGAQKIYAVDVGHNQLAYSLRENPAVVVMEKTNARALDATLIPDAPDIVVCDASFISLRTVLPAALNLAKPSAWLVALIKPQFEVGKDLVGKGGIVRDSGLHSKVCDEIQAWLRDDMKWDVLGITESPITGAEGNKEFLIAARKPAA
ncbi:MAG: TlyA family RNA methyltransferase [Alphaproteobacteria bacterium]|nr:TlyA family RNA methyltransferase [Alphaproteobacteria bacterium]